MLREAGCSVVFGRWTEYLSNSINVGVWKRIAVLLRRDKESVELTGKARGMPPLTALEPSR